MKIVGFRGYKRLLSIFGLYSEKATHTVTVTVHCSKEEFDSILTKTGEMILEA